MTERLISQGFSLFNFRDDSGQHCLFPAVKFHITSRVSQLLTASADPNIQNKGRSVFHTLLSAAGEFRGNKVAQIIADFTILHELLAHGGIPAGSVLEHPNCPCSEAGWLPSDDFGFRLDFEELLLLPNPLWLFEYLAILEDVRQPEWARLAMLSLLRRSRFERLGLQHHSTCLSGAGKDTEERFWDIIAEENKLERLRSEMKELELETLAELKERVLSAMGESFLPLLAQEKRRAQERRKRKARKPATPQPPESSISPSRRITFDDLLDLLSGSFSLWEGLDADDLCEEMFSPCEADPLTMLNQYREYLASVMKNFRDIFIGEADEREWLRPRAQCIEEFKQMTGLSPDSG